MSVVSLTMEDRVRCRLFVLFCFLFFHTEENAELEKARQEWEALENVQPGQIFHLLQTKTFHIVVWKLLF